MEQLIPLEEIKLLYDEPDMDNGENPNGVNERHMDEISK